MPSHFLTSEQIRKLKPIVDQLGPGLNRYLASIGKTKTSPPSGPGTRPIDSYTLS